MSSKKTWERPAVGMLDPAQIVERTRTREGLLRVRDLVTRAVQLMEASGEYPVGAAKAREVLAVINEELAKSETEGSTVNEPDVGD